MIFLLEQEKKLLFIYLLVKFGGFTKKTVMKHLFAHS